MLFPDFLADDADPAVTSDDWFTPDPIVQWARRVLGEIDTDPAWSPRSHVRPKIDGFSRLRDGLQNVWQGRVFCNPPYSDPEPWIRRCAMRQNPALMLVKFDPSTAAWSRYVWPHAAAVCIFGRRLKFDRPGARATSAPFPSAAVYYGPRPPLRELAAGPDVSAVLRPPW